MNGPQVFLNAEYDSNFDVHKYWFIRVGCALARTCTQGFLFFFATCNFEVEYLPIEELGIRFIKV
jgi:hypothetical protein